MTEHAARTALRVARLERGLSYEALAQEVRQTTGRPVSMMTLYRFIHGSRTPHERTVHLVSTYLTQSKKRKAA